MIYEILLKFAGPILILLVVYLFSFLFTKQLFYFLEKEVEALSFELKFGKKDDKESETNVTFDLGVTSALIGYLLIQIPNPICNAFGQGLIWFGLGMAAPEITGKIGIAHPY